MRYQNRTLVVFRYLWETTDDEHSVTVADIVSYLATQGIKVKDYRTIKADIADLMDFGIDIVETKRDRYEYHIGNRHFEVPEVKLLVDAVQSSRFISQRKSKALIQKLATFVGPHDAGIIRRELYVDQRSKSDNESVLRSVDAVQDAIAENKKVSFQYFDYSPQKEKVARHNGMTYRVSPYSLIWNDDNYYMIGFSDDRQIIQTFRIDRIDHLSQVDEPRIEPPDDYNVSDFFMQEFSMLSGKERTVELLVENHLMNNIIDRFGESVQTETVDNGHFKITVTVALSTNFYAWVFASNGKIRILSPQEAREDFAAMMEANKLTE